MISISYIIYIFVFLYGIAIGSFLNVVIYRLPRKLGMVKGHSFCTSCSHKLGILDLVPLFSYIFLGGRCRYCKDKISIRYPIVEFLNGALWLLVYLKFGFTFIGFGWFIAVSVLLCIAFIDGEHMEIPDRFSVLLALAGVLMALSSEFPILSRVIGLFAVSVPLFIIAVISSGKAMGGGDIKLMAAAGFCLGWENTLVALLLGSLFGSIYGLVNMKKGKVKFKQEVPFGPFLTTGIVIAGLLGDRIISVYLGLF